MQTRATVYLTDSCRFGNVVQQVSLLGLFGYDQSVVSVLCSLISTTPPHGGKDISLIFGSKVRSSQLAGPWPRVGPVLQYHRDLAQPSMKIGGLKLIKQNNHSLIAEFLFFKEQIARK